MSERLGIRAAAKHVGVTIAEFERLDSERQWPKPHRASNGQRLWRRIDLDAYLHRDDYVGMSLVETARALGIDLTPLVSRPSILAAELASDR